MNWNLKMGDGTVRDVIFWPELSNMDDFARLRGGNPILFPFCARSYDRGEVAHWRSPDGQRRPMPQHGLARQSDFRVTRLDERGFAAVLLPNEESRAAYPFEYEFEVAYRFEATGLACELILRNHDTQAIPWCAGHHFYFVCPWTEGLKRSDYLIRLPAGRTHILENATGALLPGPVLGFEEPLSNPALINVFHSEFRSNSVVFGERGRPGDIQVRLGTSKVPAPETTVVTWTADDQAPYYCVEPWMGPANAPENKLGLSWVAPGQSQSFVVDVTIQ